MNAQTKDDSLLDSILAVKPGLAVFDCDGTLWAGDAGERFFDWELKRGVVSQEMVRWARARYAEYQAGKVSEDEMCADMVTLHRGLKESDVLAMARTFFDENFIEQIFPEMRELVSRLQACGCAVWAVSSTNEWVIREGMRHFGIPREKILAASVEVIGGIITDRVTRIPSGPGKPKAILEEIGRVPDIAFGNSRWDVDMLNQTRFPVAVNPNPDLAKFASEKDWMIYWPDRTR